MNHGIVLTCPSWTQSLRTTAIGLKLPVNSEESILVLTLKKFRWIFQERTEKRPSIILFDFYPSNAMNSVSSFGKELGQYTLQSDWRVVLGESCFQRFLSFATIKDLGSNWHPVLWFIFQTFDFTWSLYCWSQKPSALLDWLPNWVSFLIRWSATSQRVRLLKHTCDKSNCLFLRSHWTWKLNQQDETCLYQMTHSSNKLQSSNGLIEWLITHSSSKCQSNNRIVETLSVFF